MAPLVFAEVSIHHSGKKGSTLKAVVLPQQKYATLGLWLSVKDLKSPEMSTI